MTQNDATQQTTPTVFSGAKAFVEHHGTTVWCELCDTVTPDQWFHVKSTAKQLDCLRALQQAGALPAGGAQGGHRRL
jgi:hypothetical protein